ncbi:MAG: GNAT family N-acyltransferase [Pseudomonadota bacterium]
MSGTFWVPMAEDVGRLADGPPRTRPARIGGSHDTAELQVAGPRYVARDAAGSADVDAAQRLRGRVFRRQAQPDCDRFDAACRHVLIEDRATGDLRGCFRMLHLASGAQIARSYSAQFYELTALSAFPGPMVELGRFCVDPAAPDPDILRVAWAAMTAYVDAEGIEMLFGCSSFTGTDPAPYRDALGLLQARHRAPDIWAPRISAPEVVRFGTDLPPAFDLKRAQTQMPPLLRTYLMMRGWVSDHAVIDRDLDTLHVFTGLEISSVPPARARALRALAQS